VGATAAFEAVGVETEISKNGFKTKILC